MVTPWQAAAAVVDPELRVVTVEELGILRDVRLDEGRVTVTITPTYTGCPAMDVIRADIRAAVRAAGFPDVEVETVYAPAWTTDWITDAGRAKLAAAGIVPPSRSGVASRGQPSGHPSGYTGALLTIQSPKGSPLEEGAVRCPRCGSADTEELSRFGSTACKALWRCRACAEPFDHVKAY